MARPEYSGCMKRYSDHDSPRSWGPQSTAIPVGGTLAWMIGAGALLFGVAYEVPEVRVWATLALPASLVISIAYIAVMRWKSKPPTSLHLDESPDAGPQPNEAAPPSGRHPERQLRQGIA